MREYYQLIVGNPNEDNNNVATQISQIGDNIQNSIELINLSSSEPNADIPRRFSATINPKSKPTDFLSQSLIKTAGFFISTKAFDVLSQFKWQDVEIYDVDTYFKKEKLNYFFLNPIGHHGDTYDYDKTEFYVYDVIEEQETKYDGKFNNTKEYAQKFIETMPLKMIYYKELYSSSPQIETFDFLMLFRAGHEIYVSSELKNAIIDNELTGVEFATNPIFINSVLSPQGREGAGVVSKLITEKNGVINRFYKEESLTRFDSGWRFLSGEETEQFAEDSNNFEFVPLKRISEMYPEITPFLDMPEGSYFVRDEATGNFYQADEGFES